MKKEYICLSCGSRNAPERITKGSLDIELSLWSLLLLPVLLHRFWHMPTWLWLLAAPGPLYMTWRLITRKRVCRKCRGNTAVLTTSGGKEAIRQFGNKPATDLES
jgi:ribosomal protein L40E